MAVDALQLTGLLAGAWLLAVVVDRCYRWQDGECDPDAQAQPPPAAVPAPSQLTCTWGRRLGSGSASRRTSRVTAATSPTPKNRKRSRLATGLPSVHSK